MSQGVQYNTVTGYYWHENTTFNFISQRPKGKSVFTPFETMSFIKYYTEILCTENYTQLHICLAVEEKALL